MTVPDPIDRLRDAISSHDPSAVAACFTADYRCEVPQRPEEGFQGSDRVAENWTAIFQRLPDLEATVLRRAASGPETWSEWEMVGTGPDGQPVVLTGPVIMTTRDGQVDWARFYLGPVVGPAAPTAGGHA